MTFSTFTGAMSSTICLIFEVKLKSNQVIYRVGCLRWFSGERLLKKGNAVLIYDSLSYSPRPILKIGGLANIKDHASDTAKSITLVDTLRPLVMTRSGV